MNPKEKLPLVERLVTEAMAIESETAQEAGKLGFMARAMVLASLPHRAVNGSVYQRKNGLFTLTVMSPPDIGVPYGSLPRLILAWLTTEAVRTQSRDLVLGNSMSAFMSELDLVPTGGRWGSITRLKTQATRLFSSTVNARWDDGTKVGIINQSIADKAVLWWHPQNDKQAGLWETTVTLGEQLYREMVDHPVPVDLRAIRALKQSPMALDIYTWLTYRASYLSKETVVPWEALAAQFGSDYGRVRDFKEAFIKALRKVVVVYKDANVSVEPVGLCLRPALTHVSKKR